MAIDNTKVLFQYGLGTSPSAKTDGAITFDATNHAIYVGADGSAKLVTSAVKDASFVDNKLTINFVDSTRDNIELDFGDVASAELTMKVFTELDNHLSTLDSSVSKLETTTGSHATSIANLNTAISNLEDAYADADEALEAKLVGDASADYNTLGKLQAKIKDVAGVAGGAQTSAQVQTAITNAIDALAGSAEDADDSSFVKVAVTSEKGEVKTVTVTTTNIASASDLTAHSGNDDIHVTAQQKTDWQKATDAINAFITSDSAQNKALDTLKEIQDFLSADDGAVKALTSKVDANEIAIATLNGNASTVGSVAKAVADVVGDAAEEYNTLGKLEDKIQAEAKAREDADKDLNDKINAITDGTNAVISFGGQKGEITVRGEQTGNGAVNLSMNGKQLEASIVGLKSAAFTDASDYATAAQGTKADTAVQSVVEGETNGTIKVDNVAVKVHGLGSAAYTEASAYDAAGAAATAKSEVLGTAADASDAKTIEGTRKYAKALVDAVPAATVTSVDSTPVADASSYVSIALKLENKAVKVDSVTVDTQAVATAGTNAKGLAEASDVKSYVDTTVDTALAWKVL